MDFIDFLFFETPISTRVLIAKNAIDTLYNSKFCQRNEEISRAERQEGTLYTRQDCVLFYRNLVYNRSVGRCLKKYKEDTIKNTSSPDNKSITKESSSSHKRKFKITAHHHQDFIDEENEIYIWVWNPTPPMHYVYGAGVLLLVIGGTLFPLWPDSLRTGVYYTSVSMAGFIGSVLVTGLLRTIVFGLIWCLTGGKHHFWFLPNLLADVGFFESFQPVMTYEVYDKDGKRVKNRENREDSHEDECNGKEAIVDRADEEEINEENKKDK